MKLYLVTGKQINDTGRMSFTFMFESKMPMTWPLGAQWGLIKIEPLGPNEFRPFLINQPTLREELEGVGRIHLMLFVSGEGQVLGASIDDTEDGLAKLLGELKEDAIVLLHFDSFAKVEATCKKLGIEYEAHHYDGALTTG